MQCVFIYEQNQRNAKRSITFFYITIEIYFVANLCFLIQRISGVLTAHAYKYKTKRQAKVKLGQKKMTFLLITLLVYPCT